MAYDLVELSSEHLSRVREFNERLETHKVPFRLSEKLKDGWLPKEGDRRQFLDHWLLLEDEAIRGGFRLRHQPFQINGKEVEISNYQGPVSEATMDPSQFAVGAVMLRLALRKQSLLYAYGMGGTAQPLPKLLSSAGWSLELVPFYFLVVSPFNFLRKIVFLRRTATKRTILSILAFSGAGFIGIKALQGLRVKRTSIGNYDCEETACFGAWADRIWEAAKTEVVCGAIRTAAAMNELFPDTSKKNHKLRISRDGNEIGWAVVRSTQMRDHKQFGDLRVGSIIDNLALPGEERAVCRLATKYLVEIGSDIVVSNQSNSQWGGAFRSNGYLSGPSNCAVAFSPKLTSACEGKLSEFIGLTHFTRADGDGPINL